MYGPATLDEVLNGIVREAKTASAPEPVEQMPTSGELLRKLASALRAVPASEGPTYEDLYTVKEAACGR